jgi:hypothetical protein
VALGVEVSRRRNVSNPGDQIGEVEDGKWMVVVGGRRVYYFVATKEGGEGEDVER